MKAKILLALALLFAAPAIAQRSGLTTAIRGSGSTLPTACTIGSATAPGMMVANAGSYYICTSTNTWQMVMTMNGGLMVGKLSTPPSTTAGAGINIGTGSVAPTVPVAGDMWITSGAGAGLFWRGNTTHTVEDQINRNVASGYAGLDASAFVLDANLSATVQRTTAKGAASGYAGLDASAFVPDANLAATVQRTTAKDVASGYTGLDANKIQGGANTTESQGIPQSTNVAGTASSNCTTACGNIVTYNINTGGVTSLHAGEIIQMVAWGILSTTGTPTIQFRIAGFGVATLITTPVTTTASGLNQAPWYCEAYVSIVSVAATYTHEATMRCDINNVVVLATLPASAATFSATTAWSMVLFPVWGTASISNTAQARTSFVRILN